LFAIPQIEEGNRDFDVFTIPHNLRKNADSVNIATRTFAHRQRQTSHESAWPPLLILSRNHHPTVF